MPITVTAQPTNSPPRVQISISGLTDATTTITRVDPDGRTRAVRAAGPATLTSGSWLGYDYEMPLDVPVTYTSTPPTNAKETSAPVAVPAAEGWLVHPGIPDFSLRLEQSRVTQLEDRVRAARSATHQPLGRAAPIVVNEIRSSVQAGISIWTDTLAERDAVWSALAAGTTLLLNLPPTWQWGVTWEYVAISDVTESYLAKGLSTGRSFTLPYIVVDRPTGALLAQWNYTGVVDKYATYSDVMTAFPTYSDLLSNTTSAP